MTFKLHDKVYDPAFGYGTVTRILTTVPYPLEVTFVSEEIFTPRQLYTLEGRYLSKANIVLVKIEGET